MSKKILYEIPGGFSDDEKKERAIALRALTTDALLVGENSWKGIAITWTGGVVDPRTGLADWSAESVRSIAEKWRSSFTAEQILSTVKMMHTYLPHTDYDHLRVILHDAEVFVWSGGEVLSLSPNRIEFGAEEKDRPLLRFTFDDDGVLEGIFVRQGE